MKFGTSHLAFERFPFFLGEPMAVTLHPGKPIGPFAQISISLLCIHVKIQKNTGGTYQLYSDKATFTLPGANIGLTEPLRLTFELPNSPSYTTYLNSMHPRYWELKVVVLTEGIPYSAVFLVPIYHRSKIPPGGKARG